MNIGVVGIGYWGSKLIGEYGVLRDAGMIDRLVACDADRSRLAELESVDQTADQLDDVLDDIDALHIATGNESHFDIAAQAINSGADALVEKPLTTDRELAYDLVELASQKGQILQTGHIFRFSNAIRKIKERYEDGYFGDINSIRLEWTHRHPPSQTTNVMWDLLPHPLDILNFVTGQWPNSYDGCTRSLRDAGIDIAHVVFDTNAFVGSIEVSWVDDVRRRCLAIAGSKRSCLVDCVDQTIEVHEGDDQHRIDVFNNNTIEAEIRNFIQAVNTRENTFNSAIVGARTVDIIEQIEDQIDER